MREEVEIKLRNAVLGIIISFMIIFTILMIMNQCEEDARWKANKVYREIIEGTTLLEVGGRIVPPQGYTIIGGSGTSLFYCREDKTGKIFFCLPSY